MGNTSTVTGRLTVNKQSMWIIEGLPHIYDLAQILNSSYVTSTSLLQKSTDVRLPSSPPPPLHLVSLAVHYISCTFFVCNQLNVFLPLSWGRRWQDPLKHQTKSHRNLPLNICHLQHDCSLSNTAAHILKSLCSFWVLHETVSVYVILETFKANEHTNILSPQTCRCWANGLQKPTPSCHQRGEPISKHVSGLRIKKYGQGSQHQEWLRWRRRSSVLHLLVH
jgi:hypothetical protein